MDRANAARRELVWGGMSADRLVEVRGYADRQLKFRDHPLDARNRRISLLLPFDTPDLERAEAEPDELSRLLAEAIGGDAS